MNKKEPNTTFTFKAEIQKVPDIDGAYIAIPFDIKERFGKGRLKVYATFNGEPYSGSIVNMGIKNADGSVCYILGIRKDIRAKIGKQVGDMVEVNIEVVEFSGLLHFVRNDALLRVSANQQKSVIARNEAIHFF